MTYFAPSKSGLLGVGPIEQEILNQRFDPDVHAALRAATRFAQRFLATQMHDVNVRAGQFGEGHEMMHAFRFDHAADGSSNAIPGRSCPAASSFFCSSAIRSAFSQCAVAMTPKFLRELQRLVEFLVVDAEARLCRRGRL